MSIEAMTAVHKSDSQGNASDRLVMLILANEAAEDSARCFPGFKTILKNTRMPKSTLIDALDRLEASGWIIRHTRGKGHNNHYVLVLDRLTDPDDDDVDERWHCEVCRTAAARVHEARRRLLATEDHDESDVRKWVAQHVGPPEVDDPGDPDQWFPMPAEPTISTGTDTALPSGADTGPLHAAPGDPGGAAHRTTGGTDTGPSSAVHRTRPGRPVKDPGSFLSADADESGQWDQLVEAVEAACYPSGEATESTLGYVRAKASELAAAGATPDEVRRRAARWHETHDRKLTPHALAKHWPSLASPTTQHAAADPIAAAVTYARNFAGLPWDDVESMLLSAGYGEAAFDAAREAWDLEQQQDGEAA